MELAQENLIKIAKVSQELTKVLTDANPRLGKISAPDVSRVHFWLGRIKVTSQEILQTLNQCMITGSGDSTLDEGLHCWISANGPVICLMALNEMKRTLIAGRAEKPFLGFTTSSMGFNLVSAPGSDKIHEAIKILHNHRDHFDYLLASGIWNREIHSPHQWRATSLVHSFGGGDTRHENQVRTSVRNVVIRGMPHNSYSSFSPSQETVIDELGEENLDRFSEEDLPSVCYRSETIPGMLTPQLYNNNVVRKEVNFNQVDLEKLDIILQWLDAFRCIEKHRTTLLQRQADTCTWLPDTNEYKTWLTGESSFLWLHGKAGCGKSVLVASVIDQLGKTFVDEPSAFFYCDFGKERAMNATEVIRSLLYQLVDQYRRGRVKQGAFRLVDELAEERRQDDTTLKDIVALSSLVSRVVAQFNRPPLIVIDALDECEDIDRLLPALLGLKTKRLRLFMVEAVSTDIELHVNKEIDTDPRLGFLDPELKKRVRSTLCQKADGMFRWVQCQLDTLKGCFTLQEFLEALDNLPSGLAATYERILRGINQRPSEERKAAQRALAWLVTASRSLILTEVFEALSIDIQKQTLDRNNAPIHKFALLDVLSSLVVHDEETDIISLSHFSVKEYLMDELTHRKMPLYHLNLREAHKQIFQSCMCYLVSSLNHPFDDNDTVQSRPLLDYIFSCGFNHLVHIGPPDGAVLDSMIALQSEILKHPLEWTHLTRFAALYQPYKSWVTPDHDFVLCVLISMFPEPFLHAFLHRASCKTKYRSNPLLHTVQFDKVDHARTLILHGIDVNSVGWHIEDDEGLQRNLKLPLEAALQRENGVFVDLFLKEGSATISRRVYSTIFDGQHCDYPPLFVCSLLQADDFVEWATEVHDARLLRPLNRSRYRRHQVTEEDLLIMIRRLVQLERNRSPLDSSEQILLIVTFAASGGHLSLLEYLFSIDAPMPSGVFVTEGTAPFVRSIALQEVNIKAVAAKGDTTLHQVLGRCTGDSRCWVFDCNLCSAIRPILLAALGREIEKTLTHILTTSREFIALVNIGTRDVDNPEVSPILSQLDKIVSASGQLLQTIHISFRESSAVDYDSRRWLSGKEPKACLETLQHMVKTVKVDMTGESVVDPDGGDYGDRSYPLSPKDKINIAVALFSKQRSHFRFLLALDLDDPDSPLRSRSDAIVNHESDDVHEIGRARNASSPASERNERLQGLDEPRGTADETFDEHQEPRREIDVIFVGQTGVGKSSLINMVIGVPNHSEAAAKVSADAVPCTTHTTSYPISLGSGLRCQLWDTRGLSESVGAGLMPRLVEKIRQLASQQARELREDLRDRIRLGTAILVWCVDAARIDVPMHWEQFQEVYVKYCDRRVVPVVVITRGPPKAGWEMRCTDQLRRLNLGVDVPLLMTRKYRNSFSPEYEEDARALRDLISQVASRAIP